MHACIATFLFITRNQKSSTPLSTVTYRIWCKSDVAAAEAQSLAQASGGAASSTFASAVASSSTVQDCLGGQQSQATAAAKSEAVSSGGLSANAVAKASASSSGRKILFNFSSAQASAQATALAGYAPHLRTSLFKIVHFTHDMIHFLGYRVLLTSQMSGAHSCMEVCHAMWHLHGSTAQCLSLWKF